MLRTLIINAVSAAAVATGTAFAQHSQLGTAAEAKAMEDRAIAELKADPAAALAKFNRADGGFRDHDLYVFCFNLTTSKLDAHANPSYVGREASSLKEKDGSPLGQKLLDAAKAAAAGTIVTVNYNFPKRGTETPWVPKETYITRIGNEACGVGYYK